ncbi:unnamed protein product [Clonostachys byssicola]|uniref:DUF6604 domain-containing protein n=1 Tax=Clonostachys byssicola TaxID=160290 RepID=A0A9N9U2I1_9HYPO|nr:unnamed protein product [Clonostachys byssicola]
MLPTPLLSVYEEYKKDTNSVAAWLASTARAAGCPLSLLTDCPAASGRLKGKERKQAKLKLSQASNKYIIPISKFVPLAEYVTSRKDPAISVPACVISSIERAISARAGFTTQLSHQEEPLDTEKNERHAHFVTVLKRTRNILRSKETMTPSPTPAFCSTSEKDITDTANINRFASLEINQLSEEVTDMMAKERPEPAVNDPNVYEAEQPKTFRDACDIAFMLSKDLFNIRLEITSSWGHFVDGEWDVSAAALASNTALDLARFIIHQAEPVFEPHHGIVKFFAMFNHKSAEWMSRFSPDVEGLRQQFYTCATGALNACLSFVHNKRMKGFPPSLSNYDPTVSRDNMSDEKMIDDEFAFLENLFVSSMNINSDAKGFPVLDEFTREVARVLESEQMSFFLLFAGQVFLDISLHIRKDALKAFDKMQQELSSIESTLDSYLTTTNQASKEATKIIHDIRYVLGFIKEDQSFGDVDGAARKNNMEPPLPNERHRLYKLSPVLCGFTTFHFRARVYEFSTRPSAIAVIQDVAHLYEALYSEDVLDSDWQDLTEMEIRLGLGAIFNSQSDFERPSGTKGIFKSLALQKGASVSALKRMMNLSNGSMQVSFPRRTKRTIGSQTPLSVFFMDRYVRDSGRADMRPEDVERLLSLRKFEFLFRGDDGHEYSIVTRNAAQAEVAKTVLKPAKPAKLFPHELANKLGQDLNKESVMFAFPFLVVENLCQEFLRDLSTSPSLLAMQQANSMRFGLPDSPECIVLFILLCNLHGLPIKEEVYKIAADLFRSKLSTCWGRAGHNKMAETWQLDMTFCRFELS